MSAKPKSPWGAILGRAAHTDPKQTVVPMPRPARKSFEQLAAARDRALRDRTEHCNELERLRTAYKTEMDRMHELIESSSVRVRTVEQEIRLMLADLGISARFVSDQEAPTEQHHDPEETRRADPPV